MTPRVRVTLAFTAILAVVLTAVGVFVAVQVARELRGTQDDGLRSRAAQLAAAVGRGEVAGRLPDTPNAEPDEDVAQVLDARGVVVVSTTRATRPLLTGAQRAAARHGPRFVTRRGDARVDEALRLLAVPARAAGRPVVAVVGASHDEVQEATSRLVALAAGGLAVALLVGAGGAWVLAGAVVRPVTAALQRERRFVADAGHELRTPLAILKAELEVTRMEGGDAAALRAGLASAEEEVDRLQRLAGDLLVLARADADGLALRAADVDLDAVLERAARGYDHVELPPSGLHVTADALRLEQAVRNLVDNAARHGAPPVVMHAERRDGGVVIAVRDRGPGMPPGFAERALDRFSRADAGRAAGGAGLGLAIVQAIAGAHGGSVRIADARPGTLVELRLPHRSLTGVPAPSAPCAPS